MSDCLNELELNRYYDGEAPSLASHVEQCLSCRSRARELRGLEEALTGPLGQGAVRRPQSRRWLVAAAAMILTFSVYLMRPQSDVRSYEMASEDGTVYKISTEGGARLLSLEVEGTVAYFDKE